MRSKMYDILRIENEILPITCGKRSHFIPFASAVLYLTLQSIHTIAIAIAQRKHSFEKCN